MGNKEKKGIMERILILTFKRDVHLNCVYLYRYNSKAFEYLINYMHIDTGMKGETLFFRAIGTLSRVYCGVLHSARKRQRD